MFSTGTGCMHTKIPLPSDRASRDGMSYFAPAPHPQISMTRARISVRPRGRVRYARRNKRSWQVMARSGGASANHRGRSPLRVSIQTLVQSCRGGVYELEVGRNLLEQHVRARLEWATREVQGAQEGRHRRWLCRLRRRCEQSRMDRYASTGRARRGAQRSGTTRSHRGPATCRRTCVHARTHFE